MKSKYNKIKVKTFSTVVFKCISQNQIRRDESSNFLKWLPNNCRKQFSAVIVHDGETSGDATFTNKCQHRRRCIHS